MCCFYLVKVIKTGPARKDTNLPQIRCPFYYYHYHHYSYPPPDTHIHTGKVYFSVLRSGKVERNTRSPSSSMTCQADPTPEDPPEWFSQLHSQLIALPLVIIWKVLCIQSLSTMLCSFQECQREGWCRKGCFPLLFLWFYSPKYNHTGSYRHGWL